MTVHYEDDLVTLHHGDCLDVFRTLPDASVDAVVTDPPYGLGFMGKDWDDLPPGEEWARECLRVLKPGGHLLAFGGSRTWHRLATAVEDGGFEIRDSIAWLYGSGFPKSMDVSKAIDKAGGYPLAFRGFARAYAAAVEAAGLTHADIDRHLGIKASSCFWVREDHRGGLPPRHHWEKVRDLLGLDADFERLYDQAERDVIGEGYRVRRQPTVQIVGLSDGAFPITTSATDAARQWEGWGTALKPAFEPIVVGRKPLDGTVAANVLAHGAGALNIDGCRVGTGGGTTRGANGSNAGKERNTLHGGNFGVESINAGRWPANVVLDESQAAELDKQSGELTSGLMRAGTRPRGDRETYGKDAAGGYETSRDTPGDSGGASRFFYVAKAGADERPRVDGVAHPTVKPLELMRWLVRLVTPPGGIALEPFAGSGTTVEACIIEGFRVVAIEREAEYLPLIEARIARARMIGRGHPPDAYTRSLKRLAESIDPDEGSFLDLMREGLAHG
ncbi:DNA-methyltransferase [Pimelobacter simplex]|uniref:DNA-methyltransferase n=1 Tax=Nocardioides simplex TaxID=2045 RepID=UPI003AACC8D7